MIFYKIKLKSFPKIKYACTTSTDRYKNIITHRKNTIEIGVHCGIDIEIREGDRIYTVPSESFILLMPDMDLKTKAVENTKYYGSSVAVEADFDYERIECEDDNCCRDMVNMCKDEIILPFFMELGSNYTDLEKSFRTLIIYSLKENAAGMMNALSVWCSIISEIDEEFRYSLSGGEGFSTGEYYSRKAKRYIESHYMDKITVGRLADMMNISPNYLSNIFKADTGKTLTEFIAATRLAHARNLIYEGKLNAEQIAHEVGICNGKYLNKLFKKYYGAGLRKCSMTDHEISLYHDKPWEVENLTEDLMKDG